MAVYLNEEQVWKCLKHPSKRRRTGICPVCLRDRLLALCPNCTNVRPCSCYVTNSGSSSSSSSSSLSPFSVSGAGDIVYNLFDPEPPLRSSRSIAIPFVRSVSRFAGGNRDLASDAWRDSPAVNGIRSTRSLWSMLKLKKTNRGGMVEDRAEDVIRKTVMVRSGSVAVGEFSGDGGGELTPKRKGRAWFFPSPMRAFRQNKVSNSKAVQ